MDITKDKNILQLLKFVGEIISNKTKETNIGKKFSGEIRFIVNFNDGGITRTSCKIEQDILLKK